MGFAFFLLCGVKIGSVGLPALALCKCNYGSIESSSGARRWQIWRWQFKSIGRCRRWIPIHLARRSPLVCSPIGFRGRANKIVGPGRPGTAVAHGEIPALVMPRHGVLPGDVGLGGILVVGEFGSTSARKIVSLGFLTLLSLVFCTVRTVPPLLMHKRPFSPYMKNAARLSVDCRRGWPPWRGRAHWDRKKCSGYRAAAGWRGGPVKIGEGLRTEGRWDRIVPGVGVQGINNGDSHVPLLRHGIIVFVGVHAEPHSPLLHVIQAGDGLRLGLGLGERRQQHRRQDRNDRNDDQQLDQGESGKEFISTRR